MTKFIILVACRDLKFDDGSSAKISVIRAESGEEENIGKTEQYVPFCALMFQQVIGERSSSGLLTKSLDIPSSHLFQKIGRNSSL